jgi:mono/diheme cytochrome c family protein
MPAPPHDSDGHTWHHDGATLFGITRHGLVPPWAPPGHANDMPAFAGVLSDEEIWAVLSFIASTWNEEAKSWQRQIEAQGKR